MIAATIPLDRALLCENCQQICMTPSNCPCCGSLALILIRKLIDPAPAHGKSRIAELIDFVDEQLKEAGVL